MNKFALWEMLQPQLLQLAVKLKNEGADSHIMVNYYDDKLADWLAPWLPSSSCCVYSVPLEVGVLTYHLTRSGEVGQVVRHRGEKRIWIVDIKDDAIDAYHLRELNRIVGEKLAL